MLKVTILEATSEFRQNEFDKLLPLVSQEKQERIKKFHFFQDARNSLLGDVLSRIEICYVTGMCNKQLEFSVNEYNKPLLTINPHIHFNISHAGSYIACVVSDEPVGIDIELIKPIDIKIAERFFAPDETTYITADDSIFRFYEVWTKKESRIKWEGKGLHIPLPSFSVFDTGSHNQPTYHKIFQNHEALCHTCSLKSEAPSFRIMDATIFMRDIV